MVLLHSRSQGLEPAETHSTSQELALDLLEMIWWVIFLLNSAFIKLVVSSYLKKALVCASADVLVLKCTMPWENSDDFTCLPQPHSISGDPSQQ